ncbi:BCCT family transporter [Zhihengliuella halotolerans]|uniref:Choline/carnitine/betaine transport n=1 Tax=Zhihengliuella halotolerans TaxID=370736 RepID=A0A4Q8AG03_9MICC|nr:BCCT family transporter [Zhihengliuella halotolerans]RZU63272.1 choline/carnitine/betaine transport [Zhihengliuella halotolerans]
MVQQLSPPTPARQSPGTGRSTVGAVLYASVALIAVFIVWASISPESLGTVMGSSMNWVAETIGWSYLVVPLLCIGLLVYLFFSRYGEVRLGPDDSRPEYSTWSWLAMILAAVMGIGLVSYGVAEPISHFVTPPHGLAEPGTQEAAVRALQFSYFDWGPHAWAVFGVFGLAIGYSTHRKGRAGLVSPMLRPVLGKLVDGAFGKAIDVFAVIATLFGTTTSLGLGASQINEGLARVFNLPSGLNMQIIIIAVITVLFTVSALTGVSRGIKYISQITMAASAVMALFVLFAGPTNFITNIFFRATGQFATDFFAMSLTTPTTAEDMAWMQWWTYFMMAWWLSWGAFVGIFLAKISRGRTLRQFIAGTLGVPTLVFFAWFTIFGGSAIKFDMDGAGIGEATGENINAAFFSLLDQLPLTHFMSIVTVLLVVLFFISGADSNTFVLSTLSSKGSLTPGKPVLTLWGVLTGLCAVLLLIVGGLNALQQAAMLSALPFTIIVGLLGISLVIELRRDPEFKLLRRARLREIVTNENPGSSDTTP